MSARNGRACTISPSVQRSLAASTSAGITFCPTGGIDPVNARDYLALPNVVAVGGSWLAPRGLVADAQWSTVTVLAEQATALRKRG